MKLPGPYFIWLTVSSRRFPAILPVAIRRAGERSGREAAMLRALWMRPHGVVAGLIAAGLLLVALIAAGVSACTSSGATNPASQKAAGQAAAAQDSKQELKPEAGVRSASVPLTPRSYRGTASTGDFLTITLTPASATAGTITYADLTNNRGGASIPYSVKSDGSYAIQDPQGGLVSAYELPGGALVLHERKAGASGAEDALITAAESGQETLDGLAGRYNTMQFRTQRGGIAIGSALVSVNMVTVRGYSPLAAYAGRSLGQSLGRAAASGSSSHSSAEFAFAQDGTYLTITAPHYNGEVETSYYFGSGSGQGFFLADTPDGSTIGLPAAESAAFDPGYAGAYGGMYYQKVDVVAASGGVEIATPLVDPVAVSVSREGAVTVTDSASGAVLATGTLKPVSEARYLYGEDGGLTDPCKGMFTFRATLNGMTQDFFLAFAAANGKRTVVFSSFWAAQAGAKNAEYNYFYGVGLKGM